jgi:hypothetical protein
VASIKKEGGSDILKVLTSQEESSTIRPLAIIDFIVDAIADIVFAPHIPIAYISSAERTGAAIFRKELDFARTRMIEAIGTFDSKDLQNPFKLVSKMQSGYALPVTENVDFVRGLEDVNKKTSELAANYPDILKSFEDVIGGAYKVVKDQGVMYQPKGAKSGRFTMNESSSSVRALLDVGFYIRCIAKSGDVFMIDEPELNLHPKNQCAVARLMARMVNAGIKVFITTHSDYIIKELNTLIMLYQNTEQTKNVQKRYDYDDQELLNPQKVGVYIAASRQKKKNGDNILQQAKITPEYGIEVSTFDDTIEKMNKIQDEIIYGDI